MGVEAVDGEEHLSNFVATISIVLSTGRGWFIIILFQLHKKVIISGGKTRGSEPTSDSHFGLFLIEATRIRGSRLMADFRLSHLMP